MLGVVILQHLKFEFAKFLNTIGLRRHAKNIWDRTEAEVKKEKWGSANFQNTFLIEHGFLSNKLEPKRNLIESLAEDQVYSQASNFFDVFGFVLIEPGRSYKGFEFIGVGFC